MIYISVSLKHDLHNNNVKTTKLWFNNNYYRVHIIIYDRNSNNSASGMGGGEKPLIIN